MRVCPSWPMSLGSDSHDFSGLSGGEGGFMVGVVGGDRK